MTDNETTPTNPKRKLVGVPTPVYTRLLAYATQHGITLGAAIDRALLGSRILDDYIQDGKLDGQ